MQVNYNRELANSKEGVYTFRIQGELHHYIGGLRPKEDGAAPTFAQIYFYDANMDNQIPIRQNIFSDGLDAGMLKTLQDELFEVNPFVNCFVTAGAQYQEDESMRNMTINIHNTHGKDMRQYNQLTVQEIAVSGNSDDGNLENQ